MTETKMMSQKQTVLAHLKHYGEIDPPTAVYEYDIFRLAAVVCDLKKDGVPIETVINFHRKNGKIVSRWAVYKLER